MVRGRWLMQGFYKREKHEFFDADGFYATGDKCVLDEDGFLFFQGRLGGMIKTSGANVSPEEVEVAMRAHPEVLEAAVFGIPHEALGEMVVGVAAKYRDSTLTEAELQAFVKTQISSFKTPKRIEFLAKEDLPMTASGKVRKAVLAEMLADKLNA
jgi:acyl-CoA synthetase (AMP-forming)/AMP-acid ligase II